MLVDNLLAMEDIAHQTSVNSISGDIESPTSSSTSTRTVADRHVATIHDQINIRDKRREERIKKMKERQFDQPTLHQLFRIFDSTNSHVLSLTDFQTGLIAMGFREASDIGVVSKIMAEIDDDRSGNINEAEFVDYFLRRRMADLGKRLHEMASLGSSTTVQVIEYGVLDEEFEESPLLRVSDDNDIEQLRTLVNRPSPACAHWASSPPRRWFNVNGYHTNTLMLFSQRYGIHEETMKDAGIFQRQKIELLTPGPAALPPRLSPPLPLPPPPSSESSSESPVARPGLDPPRARSHSFDPPSPKVSRNLSVLPPPLSDTTTDTRPLPPPSSTERPTAGGGGGGGGMGLERAGPPRVQTSSSSYSHFSESESATQQQHDDLAMGGLAHATIIIHKLDASPPLEECVWAPASSSSGSSSPRLHLSPDPSMIISQFAIYSINNCMLLTVSKDFIAPPTSSSSSSSSSSFSSPEGKHDSGVFTSSNSSSNSSNSSHPWEELRERIRLADADVRVNSSSAKYLAFCAMEVVMEHNYLLRDLLQQWLRDLEGEIQKHCAAHHTLHLYEFGKFAAAYQTQMRAMATCLEPIYDMPQQQQQQQEGDAVGGEQKSGDGGHKQEAAVSSGNGGGRKVKDIPTLAYFFDNEYIFFRDLTDEIETICSEVDEMISTARSLSEYYRAVQDDKTNRTLYILTLVTSVFVPAQFLTGLYGMNFDYMPELHWHYSYYIFWVIVVCTTFIAAAWVHGSFTSGMVANRQRLEI